MNEGEFIFIPTASPNSEYILTGPRSGDPDNSVVLGISVIMSGVHANRPEPEESYLGALYFETDTDGGTLFRCDALEWVQVALGVAGSAFPLGAAGGDLGGTYPDPTVAQASGAFALPGAIEPPTITTDRDDYNPVGMDTATVLRLSSTASHNLTGLAGGYTGRLIILFNVGSEDLVLVHESSSSEAFNRFAFDQDVTLGPAQAMVLGYDGTDIRWRFLSGSSTGSGGIPTSIITAKGDLIAGTAADTAAALAVGADGEMLLADGGETPGVKWAARLVPLSFIIDGGGAAITTGVKGDIELPFNAHIESVRLGADQSGSIVIDLWKDTYANFPPTSGDSITASAKPTLSSAQKSEDTTLTGWTRTIDAGDWLRVNVDSASAVERVTLSLVLRQLP